MKQSLSNQPAILPTDFERQQIFYWLKKLSSLTAWRRILSYFQAWADATENSVREADKHGWNDDTSLPPSEYALILKCLAHCESGVNRLAKGDKRVFKFDANGEFVMARRMLSHWSQMLERIELGETDIEEHTPLWEEFCKSQTSLAQAWGECGPDILEPRYLEEPAHTMYSEWLQKKLATTPFPDELAPVPDPIENIFIRTGDYTPCSGIWEPVDVTKPSFLSLITRTPKPQPPFQITGTMNYLHAGSNAPQVDVKTTDDILSLDATWRLLWRDDRYDDGMVPEEEAHYRFTKPDLVQPAAPKIRVPKALVWATSGMPAPETGRWLSESDLRESVNLQKGQTLPPYQGREVRWVLADN